MDSAPNVQMGLLAALREHIRLVVVLVVAAVVVGNLGFLLLAGQVEAVSTIVLQDPNANNVFSDTRASTSEPRFVADQIEILRSRVVSERAAEILTADGFEVTPEGVERRRTVRGQADSNVISIAFTAGIDELAVAGANAVGVAYQDVRRESSTQQAQNALDEITRSLESIDRELTAIDSELEDKQAAEQELGDVLAAIIDRLNATYASDSSPDAAIVSQLRSEIETVQAALDAQQLRPDLAGTLQRRIGAIERSEALLRRRDELSVDRELGTGGVGLFAQAVEATSADPSRSLRSQMLLVVLGLLAGAALAYNKSLNRSTFHAAGEPELVFDAPLLGAVPETPTASKILAHTDTSQQAEAYRRVASALELQLAAGERQHAVIVAQAQGSAASRAGFLANIATMQAREGHRPLIIDASAQTAGLSAYANVLIESFGTTGLSEVVRNNASVVNAVRPLAADAAVDVLGPGQSLVGLAGSLGGRRGTSFIEQVTSLYDVVLVDAPLVQESAIASVLLRLAGRTVVFVNRDDAVSEAEELARRFEFVDASVVGYVFVDRPA